VKCDEAKPACARCASTGRTCDGYEAAGTARSWTVVTGPKPALPAHARTAGLDDTASRLCFDFFCTVSAAELSRFFGRPFWCRSLLCASQQFPAVMSAMLAVASLHRRFKGDSAWSSLITPAAGVQLTGQPLHDHFAIQQYDRALRQLIRGISGIDKSHSRLVSLICGVLFTVIEVLQGNEGQALSHLDGIIRLLNETPRSITGEMLVTDVEEDLRPVISRFDVEASIFSTTRPPGINLPVLALDDARLEIFDLDKAADELNGLMAHMSHFKRTEANSFRYEIAGDIPLSILHTQQQLAIHFQRWWRKAEVHSTAVRPVHVARATLLRVHYHTSWTILQCCLHAEETAYDSYTDLFLEVVRLATALNGSGTGTGTAPPRRIFSAEIGIVFPLYWTALRCRDGGLRRAAIEQLRACSREGVWIPEIQARVAERAIEIEEGLVPGSLRPGIMAESLLSSCADVVEFRRIHSVGLDVDKANRRVLMTYQRRLNGPDGEWDVGREWLSY
jgi:hypothetical protein